MGLRKEVRAMTAVLCVMASVARLTGRVGRPAGHVPRTTGRKKDLPFSVPVRQKGATIEVHSSILD